MEFRLLYRANLIRTNIEILPIKIYYDLILVVYDDDDDDYND